MATVKQESPLPTRKVTAATLAGAATVLIVWLAGDFGGVEIPPEAASALTVFFSLLFGYFVKESA